MLFVKSDLISLGAIVGFLAVFGIAARHGILLIHRLQQLPRHEGKSFEEAIILAASEQFVPMVMTALAVILLFVPALMLGDRPGLEFIRPIGVVVIGGVLSQTLLNAFVIPTLYVRFASRAESGFLRSELGDQLDLGLAAD